MVSGEPEVEIDMYFGDVNFHSGISQELKCFIYSEESNFDHEDGEVNWSLGAEVMDKSHTRREDEDGMRGELLIFTPQLEDDGKILACEYLSSDGQRYSDQITLHIFIMKLNPVIPEVCKEGESLTLTATALLYPPPKKENIVWAVQTRKGDLHTRLHPGSSAKDGLYQAMNYKSLGENLYQMEFVIREVTPEEVGFSHSLTITTMGVKKTGEFDITLILNQTHRKEDLGESSNNTEPNKNSSLFDLGAAEKEVFDAPIVTTSNLGIILISCVVIVLIIICVACLCYRRKGKKNRKKDNMTYTAVQTKAPLVGQQL